MVLWMSKVTSRLQPRQGYLPSVSSPSVWKSYVSGQKYGDYLEQYQPLMTKAIMIPAVSRSAAYAKDIEYITEHIEKLNLKKPDQDTGEDT